jgi:hypothetical protein
LTNRSLTPSEQADAREAYNAIGRLYRPLYVPTVLIEATRLLSNVIQHNTTDGKPLRTERVPTKEDIGRRVKVRDCADEEWVVGRVFVGFLGKQFVAGGNGCLFATWNYCIIDEEAAQ